MPSSRSGIRSGHRRGLAVLSPTAGRARVPPRTDGFPIGSYRLKALDGGPLPRLWDEGVGDEGIWSRVWFLSGAAEFRRDGRFRYEAQGRIETAHGRVLPVNIGAEGMWSALGSRRVSLAHNDGRVRVWLAAGGDRGLLQRSTYRQLSGGRALALLVWSPS